MPNASAFFFLNICLIQFLTAWHNLRVTYWGYTPCDQIWSMIHDAHQQNSQQHCYGKLGKYKFEDQEMIRKNIRPESVEAFDNNLAYLLSRGSIIILVYLVQAHTAFCRAVQKIADPVLLHHALLCGAMHCSGERASTVSTKKIEPMSPPGLRRGRKME